MAKLSLEQVKKMKESPCYPGSRLVPQADGSYLVVNVPCPPDCWCPNKCMEDEEV